jgi:hypothetical protein
MLILPVNKRSNKSRPKKNRRGAPGHGLSKYTFQCFASLLNIELDTG